MRKKAAVEPDRGTEVMGWVGSLWNLPSLDEAMLPRTGLRDA